MRKALMLLLVLATIMVGSAVFAGSIDYLSNQSARYLMTFSRNAATDAADIATYNPAGTAFLAPGLTIDFSTQTLFKPYSQKTTIDYLSPAFADVDTTLEQDQMTPVLPNFYAVYNFGQMGAGNLAAFFQAGIVAGGGTLKWDNGTAGTTMALAQIRYGAATYAIPVSTGNLVSQSFEVSSVYYGLGLGVAYSFLDNMVAVSLGGRVVMPKRSLKLNAEYANGYTLEGEYEYDAVGYTPIIGICVKPITGLTIGLRYEFETDLEFEYSEKTLTSNNAVVLGVSKATLVQSGISDGGKFNQNLPAILAAGAEYVVMPGLTVMAQGLYYFMKSADLGKAYDSATGNVVGDINDYYNNGWEFSIGATYMVMPELKVGIGFCYTVQGAKSDLFNNRYTFLNTSANPSLDSLTYGLGATYAIANLGLDITVSGSWTHYLSEDYNVSSALGTASGKYEKDVYNIGLGIGYHL